ncbi:hypothetical protein A2I98_09045 [Pseudoalteromonas agarivorans]|uniref:Uncharacterized protein n=1 Tax=Pseudoalteromonas agarivorans TaxID=176102 RepID=A0ABR5VY19_9GAMM|nr:hypothetical protein A2I98_09045 [Pseudoalteromonas telluritireducens]
MTSKPLFNHLTANKKCIENISNRLKYTCLCKPIIKGGFWLVEAIKRGDELFAKRVLLLLKQYRHDIYTNRLKYLAFLAC